MTLELINPDIVVTLGAKALNALNTIQLHSIELNKNVGQIVAWNNTRLMPLYHMGPMALIHRSLTQQRSDFIRLSHFINPKTGIKKRSTSCEKKQNSLVVPSPLLDAIVLTMSNIHDISLFKLTKILYLLDYNFFKDFNETITGSVYLRMQEGPWIPALKDIIKQYENILFKTTFENKKPFIMLVNKNYKISHLNASTKKYMMQLILKYINMTDFEIKNAAYFTAPMRYIIKQELQKRNMTKKPVLSKYASIIEIDNPTN
ncbi:MAG: DUF4065 domain-containing protein [Endomicrobium sp.]|jgi:hypothetical protein|nr:DUF4065 domain-containing protein [Endomicrobium sp.]